MLNVLITGGNGQLATCIKKVWETTGEEQLHFVDRVSIRGYEESAVAQYIANNHITHIVHTSAYTAVDRAEDEPKLAEEVNVNQTATIARVAKAAGIPIIHISTDFVYGETDVEQPRSETEEVHPTSVYGRTKLESEQAVLQSGADYLILRTSWLYSKEGNNFFNTMTRLFSEGKDLKVVDDQRGTPTSAYSLARFIRDYLRSENHFGLHNAIVNFSNDGETTWFGFASKIKEIQNLPGTITPCTSAEYPQKAKRPAYSVMDLSKLKATGWKVESWEDSLWSMVSGER